MNGEVPQLASAMLALTVAAVMLVIGLLYIDRPGKPLEVAPRSTSTVLSWADEASWLAVLINRDEPSTSSTCSTFPAWKRA
jgi:hypothetical protein